MKLVIVDIDGTVSDWRWREKYLNDKEKFYELCSQDPPHKDIIELVNILSKNYKIVFCTGRNLRFYDMTDAWLSDHFDPYMYELIMRPKKDNRPDHEAKLEAFQNKYDLSDVAFVLEDRQSVVDAWRKLGFRVLQVDKYER